MPGPLFRKKKEAVTDQQILDVLQAGLDAGHWEKVRNAGGETVYVMTPLGRQQHLEESRLIGGEEHLGCVITFLLPPEFGELHGGHTFHRTLAGRNASLTLKVLGHADDSTGLIADYQDSTRRTVRLIVMNPHRAAAVAAKHENPPRTVPLEHVHLIPIGRRSHPHENASAAQDLEQFFDAEKTLSRARR